MGMIGNVIRVSQEELNEFLNNPVTLEKKIYSDQSFEADWFLDLDKSWDGINYILTGDIIGGLENEPDILQRAFFSFQVISEEQDLGYGPAQYLNPTQVKETYSELEIMTNDILKSKVNGSEMNELGIYPEIWTEPESEEFLIDSFNEFKEFYKKAAENNQAIVTYVN
ncbi:YfbM family protein [Fulvivirga maritima]|uniref:YfbM family protein n=1 Tax=Fulvivirga maritima TaxID=2904247 RepID=UPI001F32CE49|nr:YfbM family protein [Fulvivirga maritima]UII27172.1 YfbM family protein [Fulvivirga maritima]